MSFSRCDRQHKSETILYITLALCPYTLGAVMPRLQDSAIRVVRCHGNPSSKVQPERG